MHTLVILLLYSWRKRKAKAIQIGRPDHELRFVVKDCVLSESTAHFFIYSAKFSRQSHNKRSRPLLRIGSLSILMGISLPQCDPPNPQRYKCLCIHSCFQTPLYRKRKQTWSHPGAHIYTIVERSRANTRSLCLRPIWNERNVLSGVWQVSFWYPMNFVYRSVHNQEVPLSFTPSVSVLGAVRSLHQHYTEKPYLEKKYTHHQ